MADIAREFLRLTRYENMADPDERRSAPQPPLESPWDTQAPLIALPDPTAVQLAVMNPRALIEQRRSVRTYSDEPVRLEELSLLLWCTQGVREVAPGRATLRTVPSAGARHAFETYLVVNRVSELPSGLYRFVASEHALVAMPAPADLADRAAEACLGQGMVARSAVTFAWVAIPDRMMWRYGVRGLRYLYLDAGHVCQNLHLAAEAIDCGVCAIGAFDDAAVDALLGLDGETEFAIYLAALGRKRR